MDAHPDGLSGEAGQTRHASGWWPLDCLRSLGRAAAIASGTAPSSKEHPDYRGFRILTMGQEGSYRVHVAHGQGGRIKGRLKRDIDAARFGSHEEAAQYARFLIASGTLNHLVPGARS
jgi:hypothetical protein